MTDLSGRKDYEALLKESYISLKKVQSRLSNLERASHEPIAIVGIACRYPGGAHTPEKFWELLQHKTDTVADIPSDRWDIQSLYDPDPTKPGKMVTRWGSCMEQVYEFDADFFGISSREAIWMDPQQRLLLEVTWEAFEHAGLTREQVNGSQTGVFIGICASDYGYTSFADRNGIEAYASTGVAPSIAANRISYMFNLKGPSVSLDTACASSLVTVHLACQSLRSQESNVALAGGVNLILAPEITISFSKYGMMSTDGRCKTFDASANGYVRGDGCGVLILKRLSDALNDGDRILALIRGSAVNQDGRSTGLTAPNGLAQRAVIRQALKNSKVHPDMVSHIEAHGTGTPIGDPIEIEALSEIYDASDNYDRPCTISSVKANIGHTEAAAGVTSIIKVVMAMNQEAVPPQIHLKQLNPNINLEGTRFVIPTELHPWTKQEEPRLAGISAFSFGGTNAHIILQEAPPPAPPVTTPKLTTTVDTPLIFPLSAHTPAALGTLATTLADTLTATVPPSLPDLAASLAVRRSQHPFRTALIATSHNDLGEQLRDLSPPDETLASVPLVFVCSGHGAQWLGMGTQLLTTDSIFREALHHCAAVLQPYLGWDVLAELTATPAQSRLDQVEIIQPTLFAIQIALAARWQAWGITPDAVIGHSMGEIAAAHLAGILSLDHAAQLIAHRSALLARVRGQGAMAVVRAPAAQVRSALTPWNGAVEVAIENSAASCVVTGTPTAVTDVCALFENQQVSVRAVQSDVAFHSAQMDALVPELVSGLSTIVPQSEKVPFYSTVTGGRLSGSQLDAIYWGRNLREPVRFGTTIEALLAAGHGGFVEVSAHPVLQSAIREGLRASRGMSGVIVGSLRREQNEREALLLSLGRLYSAGWTVAWEQVYPDQPASTALPAFPWQRERFRIESSEIFSSPDYYKLQNVNNNTHGHAFSGHIWESSSVDAPYAWETIISIDKYPYLGDHILRDVIVVPAAAQIEMAHAAVEECFDNPEHTLTQLVFEHPFTMRQNRHYCVQIVFSSPIDAGTPFTIASRDVDGTGAESWSQHAHGIVCYEAPMNHTTYEKLDVIQDRCINHLTQEQTYHLTRQIGFDYGPSFIGIDSTSYCEDESLGRLRLAEHIKTDPARYYIHPALLDSAFQVLSIAVTQGKTDEDDTYMPVGVERLDIVHDPKQTVWAHTKLRINDKENGIYVGDILLFDEDGHLLVRVCGFHVHRLNRQTIIEETNDWLYTLMWEAKPLPQKDDTVSATAHKKWLVFDNESDTSAALIQHLAEKGEQWIRVVPGDTYQNDESNQYQLNPDSTDEFEQLLKEAFSYSACAGIIYLWSDERVISPSPTLEALIDAQKKGCIGVLHLVQSIAQANWDEEPRLWLVTRGTQSIPDTDMPVSLAQSPLWGFGRVIAQECPTLRCTRIDVSCHSPSEEVKALFDEIWSNDGEDQIALRGDQRYVVRLGHYVDADAPQVSNKTTTTLSVPASEQPFQVAYDNEGFILQATVPEKPKQNEVMVQVHLAGIDVPSNTTHKQLSLGGICVGTITSLGVDVTDFTVGDEVIALASAQIGSMVTLPTTNIAHKPVTLSNTDAAAISLNAMAVYHVLQQIPTLAPPEKPGALLGTMAEAVANDMLTTAPSTMIPLADLVQRWPNILHRNENSRLVVSFDDCTIPIAVTPASATLFRSDATYLITGGTGGLGLGLAEWMVDYGARHLVLMSRRGMPSVEDMPDRLQQMLADMERVGAHINITKADVSQGEQVAQVIEMISQTMPPLRGVIHAAGVLDDGIVHQMDSERFRRVMAPKIDGVWHLHTATCDQPLDFFVLFSSIASMMGSPGQSNYCAANAFLDTFAHYRRSLGLPALSINWGAWAEVGMAARTKRDDATDAFMPIPLQTGMTILGRLLCEQITQVGVTQLNTAQWSQRHAKMLQLPLFQKLAQEQQDSTSSDSSAIPKIRDSLISAEAEQCQSLLEEHLRDQICHVLQMPTTRINAKTPLSSLGFDSLLALELRNRLEESLGFTLSATLIWNHQHISEMAHHLLMKMDLVATTTDESVTNGEVAHPLTEEESEAFVHALSELNDISAEEWQALTEQQ